MEEREEGITLKGSALTWLWLKYTGTQEANVADSNKRAKRIGYRWERNEKRRMLFCGPQLNWF
jgi:hypothetical protein